MIITFAITAFIIYFIFRQAFKGTQRKWIVPGEFPAAWRIILQENVMFYTSLSPEEQVQFENRVNEFLANCRITGIEVTIDDTDRLLVAASAIIPIFKFPDWRYYNLTEVLLYPATFNEGFETAGEGRNILGMVGTGYMEGKMILSQQALRHGFANESDKQNTAIHEFVHLIDKMDNNTDGLPQALLERQYIIPWMDLIDKEIEKIYARKSDINPYAVTSKAEFFAVISEYFFERPQMMEQKHPELYALLQQLFKQDPAGHMLNKKKNEIGRNDPCPCRSGNKFKKCCGKAHYT